MVKPPLVMSKEGAAILGVSQATFLRYAKREIVRVVKRLPGGWQFFDRAELEALRAELAGPAPRRERATSAA